MKTLLNSLGISVSDKWSELLLPASHILIILIMSWLLMRVSYKLIRAFKAYVTRTTLDKGSIKRAETLSQVFSNVAIIVIYLITGMLILGEVGISIAPILAAAGVVGVAVGFGAQSLIKDYFTGFFLLILMRQNLAAALDTAFATALLREAEGQRIAGNTADAREGGIAFLQKRKAEFKGQ